MPGGVLFGVLSMVSYLVARLTPKTSGTHRVPLVFGA